MTFRFALAVVFATIALPVAAQDTCLPFQSGDGGSPVIDARVNGQGPFALVLDTAASGTTLEARTVAQLGLDRDAATEEAQGMGGAFSVRLFRVATLEAGPISLRDVTVPEIPAPGFDSHDIVGLAGVDLFADHLTVWRPAEGCVDILPSGPGPTGAGWVETGADWMQAWKVLLPVQIDGVDGWALLDTGAQKTVLNTPFAEALGLTAASGRLRAGGEITGLDGRPLPLYQGEVAAAGTGPWTWSSMSVSIGALPVFSRLGDPTRPLMILGMDWLADRAFAVDYRTHQVWLADGALGAVAPSAAARGAESGASGTP